MKITANGNMYERTLDDTWTLFAAHLDGARPGLVCVVSERTLAEEGRRALDGAAAALGYGPHACTFATLDASANGGAGTPEGANVSLDQQALFLLVEGIDPLCLIATDTAAARALGAAYRCTIALDATGRVFGRTCAAFRSFAPMLDDGQAKQQAWALLKKLPKFGQP